MQREIELFTAHLEEVEKQRKEDERKADELRRQEMNKILKRKEEQQIQACKAKEKLKNVIINILLNNSTA